MRASGTGEVERRALALFEQLADAPDDGNLRERLLAQVPDAVRIRLNALETSAIRAAGAIPTLIPGSADCDGRLPPPERVGPYRLVERIGRGGMGDVWLSLRDDGLYEQKVAVKLIQRHALVRAGRAFEEERRFLARLEHPNIARLIDGGTTEDGLPWLAMEFIAGRPIDEACADLPDPRRVALFQKAAEAVQYAHSRMVAHADLKPSNIQVDEDGRVKLLDFGVAGLIGGSSSGISGPLTPGFASPQRASGGGPSVSDDVFALGKTLSQLLGGNPDRELAAIAAKAHHPDEAARYGSVGALIADLDRWAAQLPISAVGNGWRYRTGKFVARHRKGVFATTLALVLLSASTILATSNWLRAERARASAEQRFDQVRSLSRYLLFDLYDQLEREPGTVVQRAQLAQTASDYLARLQVQSDAPADVRLDTARSYRRLAAIHGLPGVSNLGEPDKARRALDRAAGLLATLLRDQPANSPALAQMGWVETDRWALQADNARSASVNARARRDFDAALRIDPANAEAALGRLTSLRNEGYDLTWGADRAAQALPLLRGALADLRARRWPPSLRTRVSMLEINLLNRIGDALYGVGDVPGSLGPYREADALVDRAMAAEGAIPRWLILKGENAFNISGSLEEEAGGRDEALAVAQAGEKALKRLLEFGPDAAAEKKLLVLYGQEAALLESTGRISEALDLSRASVTLRRSRLARAPDDPQRMRDLAIGLVPNAEILWRAAHAPEACAAASEARATWARIEARGRLGKLDARKNLPRSARLKEEFCAGRGDLRGRGHA